MEKRCKKIRGIGMKNENKNKKLRCKMVHILLRFFNICGLVNYYCNVYVFGYSANLYSKIEKKN